MITETIVAQCTPSGSGAIALLRISGPQAWDIVNHCAQLSSKQNLKDVITHTIHHGWIVNKANEKLDEVLFFAMRGPRSFTGEDVIEITSHNNPFVIESILLCIIKCGARLAQPGEFSRQAVENNKLDLIQAEAINEIIQANSQHILKQSLQQLQGSLSHWIKTFEKEIIQLIALCEASFEFLEEEMDFSEQMHRVVATLLTKISELKITFNKQQQIREGVRVAIIGPANTGKSSLFNALTGKDKAIVTKYSGTTRDVLEAGLYEDGMYVTLIDTAGVRNAFDEIEQEGIVRSYQQAKIADIILLSLDGGAEPSHEQKLVYEDIYTKYKEKIIVVKNKSDRKLKNSLFPFAALKVSSRTKNGLPELRQKIMEKIKKIFSSGSSSFLVNKRHYDLLVAFENHLLVVKGMLSSSLEYELIAYHLKEALAALTELTGKSVSEKALDAVFKEFCVGK
jgi:tRNA modification GTPase